MQDVDVIGDGEYIEVDGILSTKLPSHVTSNSNFKIACDVAESKLVEMDYKSAKIYDVTSEEWTKGYKHIHDTIKDKERVLTCAIVEIDRNGKIINYFNNGSTNIKEKIIQEKTFLESICNMVQESNENGILTRYAPDPDNCFYHCMLYALSSYGAYKFASVAYSASFCSIMK